MSPYLQLKELTNASHETLGGVPMTDFSRRAFLVSTTALASAMAAFGVPARAQTAPKESPALQAKVDAGLRGFRRS